MNMRFHRRVSLVGMAFLLLAAALQAEDKIPITFPELDGWHRGTRYDEAPPRGNQIRASIAYATKTKIGDDYIRAETQVKETKGKELADLAAEQAKKIEQTPILKNVKKELATEVTIGQAKVQKMVFSGEQGPAVKYTVELYVIPYGNYYIFFDHMGPSKDAVARSAEASKLVAALVGAAK
jgi:translation initiation factor 1 (eIF-1/SUI1)